MADVLNQYGDKAIFLANGRGADIGLQREDDLDKLALERIAGLGICRAIDVACGSGGQAIRMAKQGAKVHAFDICDMKEAIENEISLSNSSRALDIKFTQCDMRSMSHLTLGLKVDVIVCQRAIHYLEYDEAVAVVASFSNLMQDWGRLYLSASGINSELGINYVAAKENLDHRYAALSPFMKQKHGIHGPVCLYSINDMKRLIKDAGMYVERIFTSEFGNIKVVATNYLP